MAAGTVFLDEWAALIHDLDEVDPMAASRLGAGLLERHREPQRSYHTAEHVEAVIRHLHSLAMATPATLFAAFFHDAIYEPTAADNEEASAQLAERELTTLGVATPLIHEVAAIVRATAGHLLPPNASDETAAFLDADLAILGADVETYQRFYVAGVRREYAHMPDSDFRSGRAAILESFLERPVLYFTDEGRRRWEGPARANLRSEIAELRS
ncbi:MAG: metal-dependent phosphohydrolase [Actinomycetota bacterium]